jgi:hypothetical protein
MKKNIKLEMDIGLKNQIVVAKKTLKMPDEIVNYLNVCSSYGGMSKDQARELLQKHGVKFDE